MSARSGFPKIHRIFGCLRHHPSPPQGRILCALCRPEARRATGKERLSRQKTGFLTDWRGFPVAFGRGKKRTSSGARMIRPQCRKGFAGWLFEGLGRVSAASGSAKGSRLCASAGCRVLRRTSPPTTRTVIGLLLLAPQGERSHARQNRRPANSNCGIFCRVPHDTARLPRRMYQTRRSKQGARGIPFC